MCTIRAMHALFLCLALLHLIQCEPEEEHTSGQYCCNATWAETVRRRALIRAANLRKSILAANTAVMQPGPRQ